MLSTDLTRSLFDEPEAPSTPSAPLSATELLATLRHWAEQGWLRRLDAALAALVHELAPESPPALLLSVALLSHLEGQGHTCLPLQALHTQRSTWLPWPPAGQTALDALWPLLPRTEADWRGLLAGHPCVRWCPSGPAEPPCVRAEPVEAPTAPQGQPLVLAEQPLRLYLRRHHADEQVVSHHLHLRSLPADDAPTPALLRPVLDQLFGLAPPQAEAVDWQRQACALALRARLGVITGGPWHRQNLHRCPPVAPPCWPPRPSPAACASPWQRPRARPPRGSSSALPTR
ncbi:MAG: hypothetical protein U5L74_12285 [Ideonella sp.]|nr:hypothetical protein [Ideonella sp.]